MSQQNIDLGDGPDSNTGDDLRTAFTKTNENFTELYSVRSLMKFLILLWIPPGKLK